MFKVLGPVADTLKTTEGLMISKPKAWTAPLFHALLAIPVLLLGAIEDWYGRLDYSTDAIGYLDIHRAIPLGEWKLIFNPQWSSGYPLLIALIRPLFPANADGEWLAIHVLNFLIYIGTYLAFLFLLRTLTTKENHAPGTTGETNSQFFLVAGVSLFLCTEICIDAVSRVSPDMLVTALFFAALASAVRLVRNPTAGRAVLLGVFLGCGYLAKAIFMPLSIAILLITTWTFVRRKQRFFFPVLVLLTFGIFAVPYIAGISWSLGRFTFGESGALNYAFHVNLLPHWTNWQGGPAGYGRPLHPTRKLFDKPSIFEFATPFKNTYPPFGNMTYWYEGYRHFWSPKKQIVGSARNLYYLAQVLFAQPIVYIWIGCICALAFRLKDRQEWYKRLRRGWPLMVMALIGIALYVQVHLEGRYIASFLAVLAILPFFSLTDPERQLSSRMRFALLSALVVGAFVNVAVVDRMVFWRALHEESYAQGEQWKLGVALKQMGLKPGDPVAAVGGPNASCTWAFNDGLRIVAEVGGEPYDPQHPEYENHHPDDVDEFLQAPVDEEQAMLRAIKESGAVALLSPRKPSPQNMQGWIPVEDTGSWLYKL
jgi:hypothetical protein